MLLSLQLPEAADDLALATELLIEILGYAASSSEPRIDDLAARVPGVPGLVAHGSVREPLQAVFALSDRARVQLAAAAEHDINFVGHDNDQEFTFRFRDLSSSIRDPAKRFMVALYDNILRRRGFSTLPGQRIQPLDADTLESSYRAANTDAPLCPACLGDLPLPIGTRSAIDREHYLPKAAYPPLAVHPFNIVLTCTTCNTRAHGPLDPILRHYPGALTELYLPYRRAALPDVALEFRLTDSPSVTLTGGGTRLTRRRVTNLDRVYAIGVQWSNRLQTHVHETVMRNLLLRVAPISEAGVREELSMMAAVASERITAEPDAFLRLRYVEWLADNLSLTLRHLRGRATGH